MVLPGQILRIEENSRYTVIFADRANPSPVHFGGVALVPDDSGCLSIRSGHWVGNVELRVGDGAEGFVVPVRVEPRKEKLPDDLWVAMLQDLEAWLPGVTTGLEGGRSGQVGQDGVSVPLIAEALLPLVPLFVRAVKVLLESPRQLDVSVLQDVPLRKMRRVDRETLKWVSRHPEIHAYLDPWKSLELKGEPPVLPLRKTIDVYDHPVNRYVSWLVCRVSKVLGETAAQLEKSCTGDLMEESLFWRHARGNQLRDGAEQIHALWKGSFLSDISKEPLSEAALQVVFDDPVYSRVHKFGRLFLNPLFRLDPDVSKPQAAVRPSFSIYEIWCFFSVGQQLKTILPDWKWKTQGIGNILGSSGTGAGAFHRAVNDDGSRLDVLFNPTFSSYFSRKGKSRWSTSGQRRPDIVVSFKPKSGEGKWVSLDAKYRVGQKNLEDAFASVHIYRDALRYEGHGGECQASVLLAPSCSEDAKDWFEPFFRETFSEGVWELKPGQDGAGLGEWLIGLLVDREERGEEI